MDYLPFHFLCFLVLGIVAQYKYTLWDLGQTELVVANFLLWVLMWVLRRQKKFEGLVMVFFFLLGITTVYVQDDQNRANFYANFDTKNSFKRLTITKELKPSKQFSKYLAELKSVDTIQTVGKVLLSVQRDSVSQALRVGHQLFINAPLLPLPAALNPHQFDYGLYLEKQGVFRQAFVRSEDVVLHSSPEISLLAIAASIRKQIQSALENGGVGGEALEIVNAMLLGQRQDMSKSLVSQYAKAGAVHILAVSGLHLGILLLILNAIFSIVERLPKGKLIKTILVISGLWCFAIVAGLSASVLRAVAMFSAVSLGLFMQRRNAVAYSLIISMLGLLLWRPLLLFDVGFQMSYAAVFGIIWLYPTLVVVGRPRTKFAKYYWQLICVSLAAQIAVLPISLYYFHQFPGLFLFSNAVIVPFLGLILSGGILAIVLALMDLLPMQYVQLYTWLIDQMNAFVGWIAAQESWLFTDISFSFGKVLLSYGLIVTLFEFVQKRKARKFLALLFAVLLCQIALFFDLKRTNSTKELVVFHENRHTIIGERRGALMHVFQQKDSLTLGQSLAVSSYSIGQGVRATEHAHIPTYFRMNKQALLVVGKSGWFPSFSLASPVVLLTSSAKVNLERLISHMHPAVIVADGSNYKSDVQRWQQTCLQTKTPFWYTGQKGAYVLRK